MARVTSVLTYTVPAVGDCQPPAPIRCGCDDLVLILNDQSLLQSALNGVLRVQVKSVAISAAPITIINDQGLAQSVWKFDYTVEYNDVDLTNADYRVRKCDIGWNCCAACAIVYTDRRLESFVKSVTGPLVNDDDPQNPVVEVEADSFVDLGDRTFRHTSVTGVIQSIFQGVHDISSDNSCPAGGIGANYAVKSVGFVGAGTLKINSAPEHTTVSAGSAYAGNVETNPLILAAATYFSNRSLISGINNPSPCRDMTGLVAQTLQWNVLRQAGDELIYSYQYKVNGGAYTVPAQIAQALDQTGYVREGKIIEVTQRVDEFIGGVLPAGGSLTLEHRLNIVTGTLATALSVWNGSAVGIRYLCSTI